MNRRRVGGVAVAAALLATGCTPGPGASDGGGSGGGERQLTVLAAASLTEPFQELVPVFERQHPGVEVRLVLDSSATLAAQAVDGAPADVLATADPRTMDTAVEGGAAGGEPTVFARNHLTLAVPRDNPADVRSLADLDGDVDYLACVETAPCGALAVEVLADADVDARPRSLEVDVKAVLQKVVLDEADAGLVYVSDVVAAGDRVREVPLPDDVDASTDYPTVRLELAAEPDLADAWIALLTAPPGRRVLEDAGFTAP